MWLLHWYIDVRTSRVHMREAIAEANAAIYLGRPPTGGPVPQWAQDATEKDWRWMAALKSGRYPIVIFGDSASDVDAKVKRHFPAVTFTRPLPGGPRGQWWAMLGTESEPSYAQLLDYARGAPARRTHVPPRQMPAPAPQAWDKPDG